MLPSKLVLVQMNKKMLPSELKVYNFKLGKLLFSTDDRKMLSSELILVRMTRKFYHPNLF